MSTTSLKTTRRVRRKKGLRKRIYGHPQRPRLTIYRSNKEIYAQIINDLAGKTLASASSLELDLKVGSNKGAAAAVGKALAEKAKAAGVTDVCFDRNGYMYHGRLKALADAAREGGLKF